MKYCGTGLRAAVLVSVCIMFFVSGCGTSQNRTDMAESLNTSQEIEMEESASPDAERTEESSAAYGMDSGMLPPEETAGLALAGQEGELVTDADTLQAVLDIAESSADQTVVEYAEFTSEEFLAEIEAVYRTAHDNGYVYGDSQTMPPCEDGIISCDRLIARALWNLGMTDQPDKGMNVGKEVWYLTTHGFELVTDQSLLQSGDIVMQDNGVSGIPNWQWHTFVLVSYDPETTMCEKYDCGHFTPEGEDRISSEQPFVCPLADYGSQRRFVCGFHLKQKPAD